MRGKGHVSLHVEANGARGPRNGDRITATVSVADPSDPKNDEKQVGAGQDKWNFAIILCVKRMFILAGANGSGKSTISKVLLPTEHVVYVNPDDVAKELNPCDPLAVRIEAGKETLRRVYGLLESGESFAIESTLSGNMYVKVLQRARTLGYETTIAYVFVDSPEVCIARIAARVQNGGHFVPDEDVKRRYVRSKENFIRIYSSLVDHWMLYYNGGTDIVLAAHGNGTLNVILKERYAAFMEGACRN